MESGQLPQCFEGDERSDPAASDLLQLVSGRSLLGVVRERKLPTLPGLAPLGLPIDCICMRNYLLLRMQAFVVLNVICSIAVLHLKVECEHSSIKCTYKIDASSLIISLNLLSTPFWICTVLEPASSFPRGIGVLEMLHWMT